MLAPLFLTRKRTNWVKMYIPQWEIGWFIPIQVTKGSYELMKLKKTLLSERTE